jgi:hypothetical protein
MKLIVVRHQIRWDYKVNLVNYTKHFGDMDG